jgi:hypothetical protein
MFGTLCAVISSVTHCYVRHEIIRYLLSLCSMNAEFVFIVKEAKYKSCYNRYKILVCFLLGDSPASEFYKPTFRNTICSISSCL